MILAEYHQNNQQKLILRNMQGNSKKKALSTIPLKTPSPDIINRSHITVTKSPDFKCRRISSRNNSSANLRFDEISDLRRQNKYLKQEVQSLKMKIGEDCTLPKSDFRQNPIHHYKSQFANQGEEVQLDIVSQKDRMISRLRNEVDDLQKKLGQISLIDSSKLMSLQRQNKTLKGVISMNLQLDQESVKKINEKLQQRIAELMSENHALKQNKGIIIATDEKQSENYNSLSSTHIRVQKQILQRMIQEIDQNYLKFLGKCDDAQSKLFKFQNQLQQIKANKKSFFEKNFNTKPLNKNGDAKNQVLLNNSVSQKRHLSKQSQTQNLQSNVTSNQKRTVAEGEHSNLKESSVQNLQEKKRINHLINGYQNEIQQKSKDILTLNNTINYLNERIRVGENQLRRLKENPNYRQSRQLLDLRRQIQELKNIIQLSRKPHTPTLDQLKIKQNTISEMVSQIQHLKQIIRELEEENYHLKNSQSQKVDQDANVIKGRFRQLQNEKNSLILDYNMKLSSKQKQIQNLIEVLKKKNQEAEIKDQQIKESPITKNLENLIRSDQGEPHQQLDVQKERYKQEIRKLQIENQEYKYDNTKFQEMIMNIQQSLHFSQTEKIQIENKFNEFLQNHKALEEQLANKDNLLQELLCQVNETRQLLRRIDFGLIQKRMKANTQKSLAQIQAKLCQVSQIQKQLMNANINRTNNAKSSYINSQLQFSKQIIQNSLLKQKESNIQLCNQVQELKKIIQSYLNIENNQKQVSHDQAIHRNTSRDEQGIQLKRVKSNLVSIKNGINNTENFIIAALNTRN